MILYPVVTTRPRTPPLCVLCRDADAVIQPRSATLSHQVCADCAANLPYDVLPPPWRRRLTEEATCR